MVETLSHVILIRLGGVIIVSLLGAVSIRAAAKWTGSADVTFGKACGTVLIACIIVLGIEVLCLLMAGLLGNGDAVISLVRISLAPVGPCILLGVLGWRLSLTLGRALLVTLLAALIGAAIVIVATVLGVGVAWIVPYLYAYAML